MCVVSCRLVPEKKIPENSWKCCLHLSLATSIPVGCSSTLCFLRSGSLPSTILLYYTTYYRIVCVPEIPFNSFTRVFSSIGMYLPFAFRWTPKREKKRKRENPFTFISTSEHCPHRTCRSLWGKACRLYTVRFTRLNSRTSLTARYTLTHNQIELRPKTYYNINFCYLCVPCACSVVWVCSTYRRRRVDSRACYI